jgi:hypothetical protein
MSWKSECCLQKGEGCLLKFKPYIEKTPLSKSKKDAMRDTNGRVATLRCDEERKGDQSINFNIYN